MFPLSRVIHSQARFWRPSPKGDPVHLQACAYSGRLVLLDKERPGLNRVGNAPKDSQDSYWHCFHSFHRPKCTSQRVQVCSPTWAHLSTVTSDLFQSNARTALFCCALKTNVGANPPLSPHLAGSFLPPHSQPDPLTRVNCNLEPTTKQYLITSSSNLVPYCFHYHIRLTSPAYLSSQKATRPMS